MQMVIDESKLKTPWQTHRNWWETAVCFTTTLFLWLLVNMVFCSSHWFPSSILDFFERISSYFMEASTLIWFDENDFNRTLKTFAL